MQQGRNRMFCALNLHGLVSMTANSKKLFRNYPLLRKLIKHPRLFFLVWQLFHNGNLTEQGSREGGGNVQLFIFHNS